MARYNTAPQTLTVSGAQTFTYAFTGGIITLTGTPPYTVTLVSPVFFPGSRQTFYNATADTITLETPAGTIVGNGVTIGATIDIPTNSTYVLTSDGANYVLTSALAGSTEFELPVTFNNDLIAEGSVFLNPLDHNVQIKPTGTGTVDISPQSSVSIQPGAACTIRPAGNLGLSSSTGTLDIGDAGKNTTFTGNLIATTNAQTVNLSPTGTGTVTIDPGGNVTIGSGGTLSISSDTLGSISNMRIGATNPAQGAFTSLTASGATTLTANTASTGTSNGTLVITGGMGVSGAIWGGSLQGTPIGGTTRSTGAFTTLAANDSVTFTKNTAATNNTTGTLVVTGGVGISGALYAGSIQNTAIGNTTRSSGAFTTLASNAATTFTANTNSTSTTTGTLVVTGGIGASHRIYSGGGFYGSVVGGSGSFTTLGATSTVTFTPNNANVTISPSGTGTVTMSPAGGGSINNMSIGATTASTGAFTTLSATGNFSYNGNGTLGNATSDSHTINGTINNNGGILNLYGVANPRVTFNGSSDSGVDAAIGATPEGLDFYEPEDVSGTQSVLGGRVWFQILDDSGINVQVGGILMANSELFDSSRNLTNVRCIGVNTADPNVAGRIQATEQIIAYYSDERLKNFEGRIENALDKVSALNGYYYTENDLAKELGYDNDDRQVGVSAQEVMAIMPEVVKDAPINGNVEGADYKTVQYEKLVPLLIEAIKELKEELNKLKGDN